MRAAASPSGPRKPSTTSTGVCWTERTSRRRWALPEGGEIRALGIDFGERRIGLALSDPTGTIASPLETVQRRKGKRMPLRKLEEIARAHGVTHLVIGLPLTLAGEEDGWCAQVRAWGDELGRRLGVAVAYVDERLTSVRGQQAVRAVGLRKTQRRERGRVDAAAAQLILQGWLDGRGREGGA